MAKKKRAGVEWVGGVIAMPAYVMDEGKPYRPAALVWMGADGAVLGSAVEKSGEILAVASDSLRSTIEQPIFGRAHAPQRVRVASSDLAKTLRAGHPSIDVVCAPTPEIDALFAAMRDKMSEGGDLEQSYLAPDIGPDEIASFFRAAAGLFRAKPWKVVPSDQSLFSVTIDEFGLHDALMSVIGQMGDSLGFVLFAGMDDFETYLDAADAIERGDEPTMPPHFCVRSSSKSSRKR
jgi:hypothetical protein